MRSTSTAYWPQPVAAVARPAGRASRRTKITVKSARCARVLSDGAARHSVAIRFWFNIAHFYRSAIDIL